MSELIRYVIACVVRSVHDTFSVRHDRVSEPIGYVIECVSRQGVIGCVVSAS